MEVAEIILFVLSVLAGHPISGCVVRERRVTNMLIDTVVEGCACD